MKRKLALPTLVLALMLQSACSKKDNSGTVDYAPQFVGTYNMSSNCWVGTNAVNIVANGTSAIILPLVLSSGTSCQQYVTIPVNVAGNKITQTTVTVIDACNNAYSETVSGTLNGNTLSLTYVTTNSLGSLTCTFSGSK